jgi:hypothetical protein
LELYIPPAELDETSYNFNQFGTIIANGALIENIFLLSKKFGLQCDLKIYSDYSVTRKIASLQFNEDSPTDEELADFIPQRHTNRNKYKLTPLPGQFFNDVNKYVPKNLIWVKERDKIQLLSEALCLNEKLLLENFKIHQELFSQIKWTDQSVKDDKRGMNIKTFELDNKQFTAFKIFKNWHILHLLNYLGISKLVTNDTKKNYAASSCFGLLTVKTLNAHTMIETGRLLEKIWLVSTKYDISLQPTAALIFLNHRVAGGKANTMSKNEQKAIQESTNVFYKIFQIPPENQAMMFRVGFAEKPASAFSLKDAPQYIQ